MMKRLASVAAAAALAAVTVLGSGSTQAMAGGTSWENRGTSWELIKSGTSWE